MKKLLIFKSQTCAPCRALSEMLTKNNALVDQITTIDSSCGKEWFVEYNVRSVPTSIILVDGKEVSRLVGYTDKSTYLGFVNTDDYVK